ncbi:glycoside hydrolase [Enterococcus sp. AZ109]|uniref:glycoside hydrolase n=1 Tax=Enterococcus sp. AZ109 TaxID=2774634 RepID=UPI003F2788C2
MLTTETNPYFHLRIDNGQYTTKNEVSYYRNKLPDEGLSFDVSNQKVLANLNVFGNLKALTFYQQNFLTEEKPGVWVNKQLTQTSKVSFELMVNGQPYSLENDEHRIIADVMDNINPRFVHEYSKFRLTVVPFCPIVKQVRLSCLVYYFVLENTCGETLKVRFLPPKLYQEKYSDQQNVLIYSQQLAEVEIKPQEKTTAASALSDPNCYEEGACFEKANIADWLEETLDYFRSRFGKLTLPDKYMASLFQRAIYQSFSAFALNKEKQLVGSNWGSYPATKRIWNKDMYYTSLPFLFFDQELMEQTILWFQQYAIKFPGSKFPGGVIHSASNALAPLLLASLYLDYYGSAFFEENPEILEKGQQTVEALLAAREDQEKYLIHSVWLSDAYALGRYHTGTNICFWKACEGLAKLYQCKGDLKSSADYLAIAEKIKADILSFLTIEGPYGCQFLEGADVKNQIYTSVEQYQQPILEQGLIFLDAVIEEGKINLMMHDGEESDTTLAAFYGFQPIDDPLYQNSMRFAGSKENPTYSGIVEGITWGLESGATFPGYTTMLMSGSLQASLFEEKLDVLKKLADLDGSWWWWPYPLKPQRGQVVRDFGCGKCGWASGIFVSLFVTHYLGLSLKEGTLIFAPMDGLTAFTWENFRLGDKYLSIYWEKEGVTLINHRSKPLKVRLQGSYFAKDVEYVVSNQLISERMR